jgi:hypothetical protein
MPATPSPLILVVAGFLRIGHDTGQRCGKQSNRLLNNI